MKLVYDINQKPPTKKNLVYAFQQLRVCGATLLVPVLADSTGLYLNQPAALFGAGMGTLFPSSSPPARRAPCSWAAPSPSSAPLAGACAYGFLGIFVGSLFAGLVYVLIALIVKKTGTAWVTKLPASCGHRPHRRPDRPEPVRQRGEQPEQHRRRQLQPGGHPGRSDRLLHHRVRLRKGHAT